VSYKKEKTVSDTLPVTFDNFIIRSFNASSKEDTEQIADIELDPCTRLYIRQTITTKEEFIEVNCPVGYAIEAIPENIMIGSIDMYPFKQIPEN
jgi:hypothetical protein